MIIKKCNSCKEEKSIDLFHRNSSQPDGHHHTCKQCRKLQSKTYHDKNVEKLKEKSKTYYKNNKEKYLEKAKLYYSNNRESILKNVHEYSLKNKVKIKETEAIYRKVNKSQVNQWCSKRRSRKLQRTPSWLTKEHFLDIEKFYDAAVKLTELTGEIYHVDHIVPLKGDRVSGLHVPWNLQVITAKENLKKGNTFLIE